MAVESCLISSCCPWRIYYNPILPVSSCLQGLLSGRVNLPAWGFVLWKEIAQIGCLHILCPSMRLRYTFEHLRHLLLPVKKRLGLRRKTVQVVLRRLDRWYQVSSGQDHAGSWFRELCGSRSVLVQRAPMLQIMQHTFPEPLQPSVANSPSRPR
jgi:hypothetical protein